MFRILCLLLAFYVSQSKTVEEVTYTDVDGRESKGFLFIPEGCTEESPCPGWQLNPDWTGLDEYELTRACMIADWGYVVYIPDVYGIDVESYEHVGTAVYPHLHEVEPDQYNALLHHVVVDRDGYMQKISNGHQLLSQRPEVIPDKIVTNGYCFGGIAVMDGLHENIPFLAGFGNHPNIFAFDTGVKEDSPPLGRVVSLSGAMDFADTYNFDPSLTGGNEGGAIGWWSSLEEAGATWQQVRYGSGIGHFFTNFDFAMDPDPAHPDGPNRYNSIADLRSWDLQRFTAKTVFGEIEEKTSELNIIGKDASELQLTGSIKTSDRCEVSECPVVLILCKDLRQEVFIEAKQEIIAKEGYIAVAIELGGDMSGYTITDIVEKVKTLSSGKTVAIGYGDGATGLLNLMMHHSNREESRNIPEGIVAFGGNYDGTYTNKNGIFVNDALRTKLIFHHGYKDNFEGNDWPGMEEKLEEAGISYEIDFYGSHVGSAFYNPLKSVCSKALEESADSAYECYDPDADYYSWGQTMMFLEEVFQNRGPVPGPEEACPEVTTLRSPAETDPVVTDAPSETDAPAGPLYKSEGNYNNADIDQARDKCSAIGMSLCTIGQLFNAVYNEGYDDLCYSGWFEGSYEGQNAGWFTADPASCNGVGWQSWTPANPGAHCCSSELTEITISNCASFDGCSSANDQILVSEAESIFCTSGDCDTDTCCQSWVAAPEYITLPETFPRYRYETPEEADEACKLYHSDLQLCTKNEVQGAAEEHSICSSGFWVTGRNEENVNIEYGQGWFVGEQFSADCNGAVGEQSWAPASGLGAAHCCVKSYQKSGYRVIDSYDDNGEYTREGAEAYCQSLGYSYSLCSQDQLEWIVQMDEPNVCMSGFMSDAVGWWQGEYQTSACFADVFNNWVSPFAGAHCCLEYVLTPSKGGPYGMLPANGAYLQASYSSGEAAAQACTDAGYDGLCTLGQQTHVAMDSATYGTSNRVGWVVDGAEYDAGYYDGTAWANSWLPPAGTPVAHCCAADTPEVELVAYPYYNGDWNQYSSKEDAAAQCTGDYSLCSIDQLQMIATVGVEYGEGELQLESSICRIGWTAEGEIGWWQGEVTTCGAAGWRTFIATQATYHCCLNFDVNIEPETPDVFVYNVFGNAKYPFSNAEDALNACKGVNVEYNLCADYELQEIAENDVAGVEGWNGVSAQSSLCYTGWLDQERSVEYTSGWYIAVQDNCGAPGWQTWMAGGTNAGAYCCYPAAFGGPPTTTTEETEETKTPTNPATQEPSDTEAPTVPVTQEPSDTEAPTFPDTQEPSDTEAPTDPATQEPTAVADSLPSSVAAPAGCADVGFSVENFAELLWCASGGTVYLNGRDTCVASDQESAALQSALTEVWENSWYLASGECTGDRSYEEATDDQLWITNEMCNNLESDINDLETQTADYMDSWIESVVELINANMANFDADTQNALTDYLATLQE